MGHRDLVRSPRLVDGSPLKFLVMAGEVLKDLILKMGIFIVISCNMFRKILF